MFCGYSDNLIGRSNEPILWLKVLLDSRLEYESLEPLIDFLAFLVSVMLKNSQYSRNFLRNVRDFPN